MPDAVGLGTTCRVSYSSPRASGVAFETTGSRYGLPTSDGSIVDGYSLVRLHAARAKTHIYIYHISMYIYRQSQREQGVRRHTPALFETSSVTRTSH